ncbi:rCG20751, partial [Rattus norvegicus]
MSSVWLESLLCLQICRYSLALEPFYLVAPLPLSTRYALNRLLSIKVRSTLP